MSTEQASSAPVEPQTAGSLLAGSSLFRGWPRAALDDIARRFHLRQVAGGMVLCKEGDEGNAMYIVADGQFGVETEIAGNTVELAHPGPGAVIGEMAVLTGQPRGATVVARTDAQLWEISRDDFREVLRAYPELGVITAHLMAARTRQNEQLRAAHEKRTMVPLANQPEVITIGRAATNDIVLSDPLVGRVHAVIQRTGAASGDGHAAAYQIVDLNSESGTYVNGQPVTTRALQDGDEIWIATNRMYFDHSAIIQYSLGQGVQVDAAGLSLVVGQNLVTLNDVSLSVYPGEFVCIVGGSGAGKSTLMNALSGVRPATAGQVLYNGIDLYRHFDLFRSSLGYVPQDDIVHLELTVYETLHYAARLRLPRDTSAEEIDARIGEVLADLELIGRRDHRVRQLSGGQRKRVSIGVELLTRPGVFFLDEPTSGLDPGLDAHMMALFRKLADQGRTVMVTTHATKNIMACDKVVFMAPGGHLVYYGPPAEALRYFGVDDFVDIYTRLAAESTPQAWAEAFRASDAYRRHVYHRLAGETLRPRSEPAGAQASTAGPRRAILSGFGAGFRQLFWLSARETTALRRDLVLLAILMVQAPVIAVALALTFSRNIFAVQASAGGDARGALTLLFTLAISSLWLGANNASREIADEAAIYARERLVFLRIIPYISAKLLILSVLSLAQSALLLGIVAVGVVLPGGTSALVGLFLSLVLVNLIGVALGLLVSSLSSNGFQATAVVIVILLPQLILAGAYVAVSSMSVVGQALSALMVSRWSLSLLGYITDMNTRLDAQLLPGTHNAFADQFTLEPWIAVCILVGFFALFLGGTIVSQKRKDTR